MPLAHRCVAPLGSSSRGHAAPSIAGLYMGGQEALEQLDELKITHVLVSGGRRRRAHPFHKPSGSP